MKTKTPFVFIHSRFTKSVIYTKYSNIGCVAPTWSPERAFLSAATTDVFSISRAFKDETAGNRAAIFVQLFVFWRQHVLQSVDRISDTMEKPLESWCVDFAWVGGGRAWHHIHQPVWAQKSQREERFTYGLPERYIGWMTVWSGNIFIFCICRLLWQ